MPSKGDMKLLIHSQTSTVVPLASTKIETLNYSVPRDHVDRITSAYSAFC